MANGTTIMVVSYDDNTRNTLAKGLEKFAVTAVRCANFFEVEDYLRGEPCQGILLDLAAMIKSKGEEKLIAYTLISFFPSLRVRAMGSMLIPMIMPGEAKQDKNLDDFIVNSCSAFPPRRLRAHKRKEIFLPTLLTGGDGEQVRCFTDNVSWGGAFLVDMYAERFQVGTAIDLAFPGYPFTVQVEVVTVFPWGGVRRPGIGVKFLEVTGAFRDFLAEVLRSSEETDRDRLVA